jgi:hypothetical protein
MIPGRLVAFLEDEGTVGVSGTRDASLTPHIHYVSGWSVESDQRTIRCSIGEGYTDFLLPSLEDNRQFSLTVEKIGSHETYQFKGEFVRNAPPGDADFAAYKRIRDRFGKVVSRLFGFPEHLCQAYVPRPGLVICFTVREIFLQTPGPGAGNRLYPPEEK